MTARAIHAVLASAPLEVLDAVTDKETLQERCVKAQIDQRIMPTQPNPKMSHLVSS
jgi:hypothetical protein